MRLCSRLQDRVAPVTMLYLHTVPVLHSIRDLATAARNHIILKKEARSTLRLIEKHVYGNGLTATIQAELSYTRMGDLITYTLTSVRASGPIDKEKF